MLAGPIPLLTGPQGNVEAIWTGVLPLGALGAGVALMRSRPRWAEVLLLGAFPPALLVAGYLEQPPGLENGLSGYAVAVASLGLALYLIGALRTLSSKTALDAHTSAPLDSDGAARSEPRRRVAGAVWVTLAAVGAFIVFGVAPYVIDTEALIASFGPGATEARLLMAAIGTCLGLGSLVFTVAPALRARRETDARRSRRMLRPALYLVALVIAAVFWWLARL